MEKKEKDKKSSKKENDKVIKNTIDLNPTIDEEKSSTAVFTFGRMNPPTIGHEKLVKKVEDIARQNNAMPHIYLSQSHDSKKNPLPYKTKIAIARKAFGSAVTPSSSKTVIQIVKELEEMGHKNLIMVVGSDRVNEFRTLLNKYNGKDFTFDTIEVVSAGERDPDADGPEGMSASKMRDAVATGNEDAFKQGLPTKLKRNSKTIFNAVKSGLAIAEELEAEFGVEDLSEVLNLAQRRKRALSFRRAKSKILRGRKIAQRRMASKDKLKIRARRKAIQLIRRKVAGAKGLDYANLTPSEKEQIDKRVDQRKGAIAKIASRLMPKVTKAERERLKAFLSSKNEEVSSDVLNIIMEAYFKVDIEGLPPVFMTGPSGSSIKTELRKIIKRPDENVLGIDRVQRTDIIKAFRLQAQGKTIEDEEPIGVDEAFVNFLEGKHHMAMDKNGRPKHDKRFRFNKKVEVSEEELFNVIDIMMESLYESEKIYDDIQEKSEKSGIDFDTLFEKLIDADNTTEAYQNVNTFVATEGKRPGLWDNIHAKRKRIKAGSGEEMRKPGSKGAPTDAAFKAASEAKSWRSEGHYLENGEEWDGDQHAYEGEVYTGKEHGPDSKRLYHFKELPVSIRAKIQSKLGEAISPAQQAAIAIAKKKSGKYDEDGKRIKERVELEEKKGRGFGGRLLHTKGGNLRGTEMAKAEKEEDKVRAMRKQLHKVSAGQRINKAREQQAKLAKQIQDAQREDYAYGAQKGLAMAKKLMGEETEHDKCGTPDCCGQCDTATQNLDEAFTAMIGDTVFANEFSELHTKGGFTLHPSVERIDESGIKSMLFAKDYKHAAETLKKVLLKKAGEGKTAGYWASEIAKQYPEGRIDPRKLVSMVVNEEHGAGEEGTDGIVKKYKKDTPGQ